MERIEVESVAAIIVFAASSENGTSDDERARIKDVFEGLAGDDDARVLAILDKMAKQRRESIAQFQSAGRQDLVDSETAELVIIQEFLPQALTDAELDALLEAALAESGAAGMKDMGKVMAILKPQVQGRTDMGAVSQRIKARLSG